MISRKGYDLGQLSLPRHTKARPCRKHEDDGRYYRGFTCGTPYCEAHEWRCKKCRWFISECLCHFCSGQGRESGRVLESRQKRRMAEILARREVSL